MSGDSPNTHQTDIFDFKEGRQSPGPTTSKEVTVPPKDIAIQSGGELVQASVLVEPDKDRDEGKDAETPILNSSPHEERRCSDAADQTVQLDEMRFSGKDRDRREKKKLNGDLDRLDGVWVPGRESRKDAKPEEDDDNCAVKCLYYSMQCCECAIM